MKQDTVDWWSVTRALAAAYSPSARCRQQLRRCIKHRRLPPSWAKQSGTLSYAIAAGCCCYTLASPHHPPSFSFISTPSFCLVIFRVWVLFSWWDLVPFLSRLIRSFATAPSPASSVVRVPTLERGAAWRKEEDGNFASPSSACPAETLLLDRPKSFG